MSRFYDIRITDPTQGDKLIRPIWFKDLNADSSYTSYANGLSNPNALDVELVVKNFNYGNFAGTPKDGSYVRIFGVSLQEVSQSFNLNGMNISIKGGMKKGLPLAKPEQSGVLANGRIFQALGNWEGVDKTLELMIYGAPVKPRNFQFIWEKGDLLENAIATTLSAAMPEYKQTMAISPRLRAVEKTKPAFYADFTAFGSAIARVTADPQYAGIPTINGKPYEGVQMTIRPRAAINISSNTPNTKSPTPAGSDVLVYDFSRKFQDTRTPDDPLPLQIEDFIGQPTWLEPSVISFKMVMRADIRVGDFVKLPQKPFGNLFIIITPGAAQPNNPSRNQLAFQSTFCIRRVSHYGRFRSSDTSSWVSVFEGIFTNVPLNQAASAPQGTVIGGP